MLHSQITVRHLTVLSAKRANTTRASFPSVLSAFGSAKLAHSPIAASIANRAIDITEKDSAFNAKFASVLFVNNRSAYHAKRGSCLKITRASIPMKISKTF